MTRKPAAPAAPAAKRRAITPAPEKRPVRARPDVAELIATAPTVHPAVKRVTTKRAAPRPADDPLAPERTRYVVQFLGSQQKLAQILGVNASQPSRWASGSERPSVTVAPLLIDLEHVLARVRLVWAGKAAVTWLESANAYLGGSRPLDVLRLQGAGPVLEALDASAWGGSA